MTPRSRVEDEAILTAASRAMVRLGPGRATMRAIAAEAGLSAGRLVQRFGSKRALLLAVAAGAAEATLARFTRLRALCESPLEAIRAYADSLARVGDEPDALTHYLALLQLEQTDPEFRAHAVRDAHAASAALRELITAAVAAGELRPDAVADGGEWLARRIQVTVSGSLLTWATLRLGGARAWVRDDLDALLGPFETSSQAADDDR
jgi:AcrR family transcriptional regulator